MFPNFSLGKDGISIDASIHGIGRIGGKVDRKGNLDAKVDVPHVQLRCKLKPDGDVTVGAKSTTLPVDLDVSVQRDVKGIIGIDGSVSKYGATVHAGRQLDGSGVVGLGLKTETGVGLKIEGNSRGKGHVDLAYGSQKLSLKGDIQRDKKNNMILSGEVTGTNSIETKSVKRSILIKSKGKVAIEPSFSNAIEPSFSKQNIGNMTACLVRDETGQLSCVYLEKKYENVEFSANDEITQEQQCVFDSLINKSDN